MKAIQYPSNWKVDVPGTGVCVCVGGGWLIQQTWKTHLWSNSAAVALVASVITE